MSQFAALQPALVFSQDFVGITTQHPSGQLMEANPVRGCQPEYTAEDWENHKHIIERLYLTDKKPWKAVLQILRHEYDFRITRRQFFKKVDQWKFYKNVKNGEMRKLDLEERQRRAAAGKPCTIKLHGRNVRYDKLERWRSRQQLEDQKAKKVEEVNSDPSMRGIIYSQELAQADTTMQSVSYQESKSLLPLPEILGSPSKSFDVDHPPRGLKNGLHPGCDLDIETKLLWMFESLRIHYDTMSIDFEILRPLTTPKSLRTPQSIEKGEETLDHSSTADIYHRNNSFFNHRAIRIPRISQEMRGFWNIKLAMRMFEELSPFPSMRLPENLPQEKYRRRLLHLKHEFDDLNKTGGPEVTLDTMSSLAHEFVKQGDYEKAEKLSNYVANAKKQKYGSESTETLWAYIDLINVHIDQGRFTLAEKIHQTVRAAASAVDPRSSLAIEVASTTAVIMFYQCRDQIFNSSLWKSKYLEVENLQRQVLQIALNKLGPSHPRTILAMDHLACTLEYSDRIRAVKLRCIIVELMLLERSRWKAESYRHAYNTMAALLLGAERQIEARTEMKLAVFEDNKLLFGSTHPKTLSAAQNLGTAYFNQGLISQSELVFQQNFKNCVQALGPAHPRTLKSLAYLARISLSTGNIEKGLRYSRKFLDGGKNILGRYYLHLLLEADQQAQSLQKQQRYDEALKCHMLIIEGLAQADQAEDVTWYLSCCSDIGRCYRKTFRYKDAAQYYEKELVGREALSGLTEEKTLRCLVALGLCYEKQGLYQAARDLFQRVVTEYTLTKGSEHEVVKEYQDYINNLGSVEISSCIKIGSKYESEGKYHDAILFYEDSLERMMWKGEEHPDIQRLEKAINGAIIKHCNDLGQFYEVQGRYLEAIALYGRAIDGYYSYGNDESHLDVKELRFRIDKAEIKNCELQGREYEQQGLHAEALDLYRTTFAKHEGFQTREHQDLKFLRQCIFRAEQNVGAEIFGDEADVVPNEWFEEAMAESTYGYIDDTVMEENLESWIQFEMLTTP